MDDPETEWQLTNQSDSKKLGCNISVSYVHIFSSRLAAHDLRFPGIDMQEDHFQISVKKSAPSCRTEDAVVSI